MNKVLVFIFGLWLVACGGTKTKLATPQPTKTSLVSSASKKTTSFQKFKESFFPQNIDDLIGKSIHNPCKVVEENGSTTMYTYNAARQKVETSVIDNNGNSIALLKHIVAHSPQTRTIVISTRNAVNELENRRTLKYDNKQRTIESIIENFDDSYQGKVTYQYDEEGYLVEERIESSGATEISKFTYDDSTNTINVSVEQINGNKLETQIIRYDEALTQSVMESRNYTVGSWKKKKEIVQFRDSRVQEMKVWKDGAPTSTIQFDYQTDSQGRVVDMITTYTLGSGTPFSTSSKLYYDCQN